MQDAARAQLEAALAGRYVIERELGRGGMAVVHLARDLKQSRRRRLEQPAVEEVASISLSHFVL